MSSLRGCQLPDARHAEAHVRRRRRTSRCYFAPPSCASKRFFLFFRGGGWCLSPVLRPFSRWAKLCLADICVVCIPLNFYFLPTPQPWLCTGTRVGERPFREK
ncbi:hypothetical protein, unlikely [Trypanosoma brucei gambiense DAL972]|uniref:Uncharacterized protein n=1 Tax=Trypanosoma brucei gambiense (strain MHOM/CI/86/DAL972) TaxID=679716 RepID=C9ZXM6_TRYB9|nr:hypothetical protein, unlikely [Trypanosoma brucei gambiense DAL972]CBH14170.1 hypothetical protein, unlikely [Trypanosoma brucei gambiense DAL972]|eukprot:XP_011776441.1 hypothetical protein, unlikely [Trypanosoma brucei gambiense DAL972]